jgi:hypothetical protein
MRGAISASGLPEEGVKRPAVAVPARPPPWGLLGAVVTPAARREGSSPCARAIAGWAGQPEGVKFAVVVGVFVGIGRWLAGDTDPTESADYDDRFVALTTPV